MLHMILFILKIICWVLLAILGIIVLLVCVVLFTPLRYEIKGKCGGNLESLNGDVRFSYFLHLISGNVRYADKKLVWKLRIAWKKISSETDAADTAKEIVDKTADIVEDAANNAADVMEEVADDTAEKTVDDVADITEDAANSAADVIEEAADDTAEKTVDDAADIVEDTAEDTAEETANDTVCSEAMEETVRAESAEDIADNTKDAGENGSETDKSSAEHIKKEPLTGKINRLFEKISCKFTEICDKIKELIRKKEIIMDFLTNEIHKKAFLKVISELKRLPGKLKPKQINGNLEFGFEDPALTGKVLAGFSILYPYWADNVQIYPRFEEKILKGDINIKGKAAASPFAFMGLRLLLNKNILTTIKHVRQFKLD